MDDAATIPDERLELIFTCCHPALALEAQVALTLRALGGLSTDEIALAFLVPFETMSKRLTRAKHKIRDAGIRVCRAARSSATRPADARPCHVYLIFNEGLGGGPCRPRRGSDPPRPGTGQPHAGRAGSTRAASADAAARRPQSGPPARRAGRPPRRPGPYPVGHAADRRGPRAAAAGHDTTARRALPGPSGHRGPAPGPAPAMRQIAALYETLARQTGSPSSTRTGPSP